MRRTSEAQKCEARARRAGYGCFLLCDQPVEVRQAAVGSARAAGLDNRRVGVKADDAEHSAPVEEDMGQERRMTTDGSRCAFGLEYPTNPMCKRIDPSDRVPNADEVALTHTRPGLLARRVLCRLPSMGPSLSLARR